MNRKSFLKPFVSSVATLLATTQVAAALPSKIVEATEAATPSAILAETLSVAQNGEQFAQHASHSSHSSHASHSSHSSSSY